MRTEGKGLRTEWYRDTAAMCIGYALAFVLFVGFIVPSSAAGIPPESARYRIPLTQTVQAYCGLGCPVADYAAQIHQESRWRADAKSPVGAQGMAQFMPATSSWVAGVYPRELGDNKSGDPVWAMRALVLYDRWLWARIKADTDCEHHAYVLSAYNGGLGYVHKRQKLSTAPGRCLAATCDINPGIRPAAQAENAAYPRLILLTHAPLYERAGWGRRVCA